MTISLSPTQDDVFSILGSYIQDVVPGAIKVVQAQINRVPEPKDTDYVVMNDVNRRRISTNIDQFVDTRVTGSISGTVMTVSAVSYGMLKAGSVVFGVDVINGTQVVSQITGSPPGGVGTYLINNSQSLSSRVLAAGVLDALQPTEVTVQVDVHGPKSADNAQVISTMMRDDYGVEFFKAVNPDVVPLYADDPQQIPFYNESQQVETRWVLKACLHVNATVSDIPQQFFEKVVIDLIAVDLKYAV